MKELILIQEELKAPKNQKNSFGNYNYRSCEDILEALKPLLKKHNCYINLSDEIVNVWTRYYVKATARLVNWEWIEISAVWFAREEEQKKWMDWSQVTGASSSYARKYALNWLFAIDDEKDSDSTNKWDSKTEKEWFNLDDEKLWKIKESIKNWKTNQQIVDWILEKYKLSNKNKETILNLNK